MLLLLWNAWAYGCQMYDHVTYRLTMSIHDGLQTAFSVIVRAVLKAAKEGTITERRGDKTRCGSELGATY